MLFHALAYGWETQGVFDITSSAASRLWRKAVRSAQIPSESDIAGCCSLSGLADLILNKADGTAFLRRNSQQIDLGGIAKGYAADEAVRILKKYKGHNAFINFGGTVVVLGREQKIGVQNPFQKSGVSMADIMVKNKAVVTSGSYEHGFFFEGVRYHHIIDLRTGWPADSGLLSVTLIGDSTMELDVTFREDANTTIDKTAAQNQNIIRKWCLSILKMAELSTRTKRLSMKKKSFVISLQPVKFLEEVLNA